MGQLRAFQAGLAKLAEDDIGVISLSADPLDQALAVVTEHRLQFPVAHGASVDRIAAALGVYYEPPSPHRPSHLHSAGFVLGPGGRVLLAVYSSGAIGRLVWQDVLGLIKYLRSQS
jgi:peroxiredoxin